ncbi:gamma-cadinene synthase-like isoform X1 [Salvia hispanica]|uniref:gamma-cadinene synthase-like isoform X1 n=1 Tax=Salvia hispanica TaxID=49212 RepID=UPI002009879D|nr:gamma-cadinene synthase-like isoform X1 [Salvia hispanica]
MAAANIESDYSSNVRHIRPPIVLYKPSMWGDIFSTFSFDNKVQEKYSEAMEALKKEIGSMLMAAESTKLMILIDRIERLGVAYHFEYEIEEKLKQIYDSEEEENYDVFTTALRFRLLRQHQYPVSCDVFNKFVDKDSKWRSESHSIDIEGILCLYEAAHVRIHNEKSLDEAAKLTVDQLNQMLPTLDQSPIMIEKVEQSLKHSIHRGLPLLNIRFYISIYERERATDESLLKLAKLNFNFLQNIYRKELAELTRWDLDEIDVLPDFMKVVYRAFVSEYEDYVVEAEKQGKPYVVPYYKEAVIQVGRAYNQVQKWIMERQMPGFEEYMTNAVITSCIFVMFTSLIPGMKSDVNEEVVQWLHSEPKIVISTAKLGRTVDDLGTHERENREGKLPTVVDCYMKDKGVSKQEAINEFVELVENGWKDITAEWIKGNSSVPKEMMEQLLNYGRMAEITYTNKEDGFTYPEKYLGPLIASLYVDPLPLHI